ncbi:unnamed protein product [Phytomonas sp. Hart1]|nr:unnamed protein product [Phytomonas sp. Hart1]|eukprot:CCW66461.1 unnamed protein product [Phytomonas sp. isolate Hart1]
MDAKGNNINHKIIYPRCLNSSGCIAVLPASSSHSAYIAHCRIFSGSQKTRKTPQQTTFGNKGASISSANRYVDNFEATQPLNSAKKERRLPGRSYFSLCIYRVSCPVDDSNEEPLLFFEVREIPLFFENSSSEPKVEKENTESSDQAKDLSQLLAIDTLQWAGLGLLVVLSADKGEVLLVQTSLVENNQKAEGLPIHRNYNNNYEDFCCFDEAFTAVVLRDVRVKTISTIGVRWCLVDSCFSSVVALVYHSSVRLINIESPSSLTFGNLQKGKLTIEHSLSKKFTSISANAMPYLLENEFQREGILLCGCAHTCCVSIYIWLNPKKEPELLREVMVGEGVSFFCTTTFIQTEKTSANILNLAQNDGVYFAIAGSSRSRQEEVRSEASERVVLESSSDPSPSPFLLSTGIFQGTGGILAEIEENVTKSLFMQTTREPLNMIYNSLQKKSLDNGEDSEGSPLENLAPAFSVTAPSLSSPDSDSFIFLVFIQQGEYFHGIKLNELPSNALKIATKQYALDAAPLKEELGKLGSSIRILPYMQEIIHPHHEKSYLSVGFYSNNGVVWLNLSHPNAKVKNSLPNLPSVDLVGKYLVQEDDSNDFIVGVDWRSATITGLEQNHFPELFLLTLRGSCKKANHEKKEKKGNKTPSEECTFALRPSNTVWSGDGLEILTLSLNQHIKKKKESKGETIITVNLEELSTLIHNIVHKESQAILTRLENRLDRLERYLISTNLSANDSK